MPTRKRVVRYATELTRELDPSLLDDPSLEYGFLLHDVGKIGIPDQILQKPAKLSKEERSVMRTHAQLGAQLLSEVPLLQGLGIGVIRSHHERWDGSGYPDLLGGSAIPIGGRIFAVADTLDAMTSDRPYREAFEWNVASARSCSSAAGSSTRMWSRRSAARSRSSAVFTKSSSPPRNQFGRFRVVRAVAHPGLSVRTQEARHESIEAKHTAPHRGAGDLVLAIGGLVAAVTAAHGRPGEQRIVAQAGTASAKSPQPKLISDVKTGRPLGSKIPAGSDPIEDYIQPDTQIEPSIAVNPANPKNAVAVYQEGRIADGGDATNGYATTFDGGKHWTYR